MIGALPLNPFCHENEVLNSSMFVITRLVTGAGGTECVHVCVWWGGIGVCVCMCGCGCGGSRHVCVYVCVRVRCACV